MARKVIPLHASTIFQSATTSGTGSTRQGSSNEVWRCPAFRDSDYEPIVLFVKPSLTLRQCAVELLAAHVGRLIGVPCPEPYLVLVNPRHIGRQGSKQLIAYGSVDLSTQGVTTPFRDVELMFRTLERLKCLDVAIVFDEWIANSVRQARDVLFSAGGKDVVFLDHERAMGQNVAVDEQVANWLADRVLQQLEKRERSLFLGRLRKAAQAAYAAALAEPPRALQFHQDGVRVYRELTAWLAARLHHLDRHLSIRAMPDQKYLPLNSLNDAAPGTTNL